jgi:sigma-B regulation protein RsbU (phosphoserine phosphatase)
VRDIYMGLRMGLARDFKIVRTLERLNDIIHRSTLTSRFVSMFYGELDSSGLFIYVNAGHPPPFQLKADGTAGSDVVYLEEGGPVLGPLPEANYERGMVKVSPGDLLVFYTDGITETPGDDDGVAEPAEFGLERLIEVAREHRGEPSRGIVDAVFAAVEGWCGGRAPVDDRTVMVVQRRG